MLKSNLSFMLFVTIIFVLLSGCSNEYKIETFDYKAEYDRVSKTKSSDSKKRKDVEIVDITKRK